MSIHRVHTWRSRRVAVLGACLGGVASTASLAEAATWTGNRTTPRLSEIVAIDATGEAGWPYGQEDVSGDGPAFQPQEQSVDVRTAYAAADSSLLWVRSYVSDSNSVGGSVTVFVFIDSDGNTSTGGSAASTVIHALFTTDPSQGGYEYVMALRGNGTVSGFWQWRQQQSAFVVMQTQAGAASGEAGADTDPILINGPQHGYVQGNVSLSEVGLTPTCAAKFLFRSVNDAAGQAGGDLDVGRVAGCIPADSNSDGVPDVIVPPQGCSADAQCPGGGLCVNGKCVLPHPCVDDQDCGPDEECTDDGRCVPRPTASGCTSNEQCDGLICEDGECLPCTPGGTQCGAGNRCGPDGTCYAGVPTGTGGSGGTGGIQDGGPLLEADETVEGGACHCTTRGVGGRPGVWMVVVAFGLWVARRRRSGKPSAGEART
jgi:hypothetical protein